LGISIFLVGIIGLSITRAHRKTSKED